MMWKNIYHVEKLYTIASMGRFQNRKQLGYMSKCQKRYLWLVKLDVVFCLLLFSNNCTRFLVSLVEVLFFFKVIVNSSGGYSWVKDGHI